MRSKIKTLTMFLIVLSFAFIGLGNLKTNKVFASENYSGPVEFEQPDWAKHPGFKDNYTNSEIVSSSNLPYTGAQRAAPVKFQTVGTTLKTDIYFEGEHYIYIQTFEEGTDMSLFEDNYDTLYIYDGLTEPQIYINHDNERPYLSDILTSKEDERPAFVPHTVWFMKSNELKTILTYDSYLYFQEVDGVIYAFYYTDDIKMDNILNITMKYSTQIEHKGWFGLSKGKMSEPEEQIRTFISGEYQTFRKKSQGNWIVNGLTDLLKIQDKIQELVTTTSFGKIKEKMGFGYWGEQTVPQIKKVNKSEDSDLVTEMRNHLNKMYENFNPSTFGSKEIFQIAVADGAKDHKGFLNNKSEKTHIYNNEFDINDEHNAKIISIQYETNGKIYVSKGEDINLHIGVAAKIDAIKKAEALAKGDSFFDRLKKIANIISIVTVSSIGLMIVVAVYKGLKPINNKNIHRGGDR